ncbi:hypothetical protein [Stenomitos frigidus]
MLPRFFVTLPLTGAFEGQVVSLLGLTPRVDAFAESVGAACGAMLDIADGEAAGVLATVLGVADIAGDGAVAISSGFLEQLESAIATENATKIATGRSLILVFILIVSKRMDHDGSPAERTNSE